MQWESLTSESQLQNLTTRSFHTPQIIFKHSTTCVISKMAWNRVNKPSVSLAGQYFVLDLLKHRTLSNQIATQFQILHESPQLLLIQNGQCIYSETHTGIDLDALIPFLQPAL